MSLKAGLTNSKIINSPSTEVIKMLKRHMSIEVKQQLDEYKFNTIALINSTIPNIFYYADVAKKAGNVLVAELTGNCPQHVTTLALFGDVSAVESAIKAIETVK